ncbi:MAG TPA: serine hydrolase domain-containing protein [Candidatus Binatia bacterium]|nr:serine hydrolase domain-containing protein [Candidatus Binatia bacterium]
MNTLRFVGVLVIALHLQASTVPSRFKSIPERMQKFVDDGTVSGAVTLVAHKGEIVSVEAVGLADIANKKPMRPDSLFWIASMTKPITATAIMILQDEGKLSVDDPVEKYLPEFKNQWLIDSKSGDTMTLKKAPRTIMLRDLLTHTSGLSDVPAPRANCTLAELAMAYSQLPLKFPPGSKWEYCNSGMNVLGRIVEVASGQGYAEFLQERIFKPLAMKDTTFWLSGSQGKRLARSYQPAKGGGLEETNILFIRGDLSDRSRTAFPSGGLFSTAQDMWRFYQMALNGGEFNDKRIVSRGSVDLMTRTQTGDIRAGFTEGMSFGYGWGVVKQPTGITEMLSPGTFGHGGAYGTQGWIDPKKELICVLMIQRVRLPNADASPIRKALQEAAVAGITQ